MADARVLVVDDEKSMRDLLAITLEKQHFEVTVADGGQTAIATLRREPFDVVITDLRMPTADGLQVLRAAKETIDRGLETDLDTGLEIERMLFASLFATKDREIGMTSFVQQGPGKANFEGA